MILIICVTKHQTITLWINLKSIQQNALIWERQKATGIGDGLSETQSNIDPDIVVMVPHMANVTMRNWFKYEWKRITK